MSTVITSFASFFSPIQLFLCSSESMSFSWKLNSLQVSSFMQHALIIPIPSCNYYQTCASPFLDTQLCPLPIFWNPLISIFLHTYSLMCGLLLEHAQLIKRSDLQNTVSWDLFLILHSFWDFWKISKDLFSYLVKKKHHLIRLILYTELHERMYWNKEEKFNLP